MGRPGAVYHISFPVVSRASFGVWGSFWPVINRVVMACIWYGVQSWIGGECVALMILAIWPNARTNVKNTMSLSSGTNTFDYMCFFLFWVGSLPAMWFPIHQLRYLFAVKSFCVPVAGIAFLAWTLSKAHGVGESLHSPSTITGSEFSWIWIASMMSCISNFAALILNNPDFTRFADKPKSAVYSQMLTIPIGFGITSLIGVLVSYASGILYEKPIWNPLLVLGKFLESNASRDRAGVFFIAAIFTLAQLGTNIAANSASAGTDLTALFPRFINIRRGSFICCAVGLAMCPWNLLSSSNNFTTYLSSYSVFLSSIAGVIASDYYVVRNGMFQVNDLYSVSKSSHYWYTFGFSWKAYASYIAGILINVVGFAGSVGNKVPMGAEYLFRINYFCGFIVAFVVYYLICLFFPVPATSDKWLEIDDYIDATEVDESKSINMDGKDKVEYTIGSV
ncbi:putative nucleobase permease [Nadsonia fulvescens var. elongata DSM 6958]|uniref:Putative nucleobase permease n=1 Tax=Nadsonia fulvescens var. elongata DSM 6958 TaxID=857566 RepID=A0A1E3PTR9_9ASCO|nr:putative nucleobase permease [Nadsonia fulvescens var. elongata DSM 6958]